MSVQNRVPTAALGATLILISLSGHVAGQVPEFSQAVCQTLPTPDDEEAPVVEPQVIIRLARAATDTAREAVVAEYPVLLQPDGKRAVRAYVGEMMKPRRYAEAELVIRAHSWLADRSNDDAARTHSWVALGSLEGQRGNLTQSLVYLEQALDIARRRDDPAELQPILANMGIVHRQLGDYETAEAELTRALGLARQIGRCDSEARVINNFGTLEFSRGNAKLAQEYFARSLELKIDNKVDATEIANSLNNFGALYEEEGDFELALSYFRRAVAMLEQAGGGPVMASSLINLGHAQSALGRKDDARAAFERALAFAQESGERKNESAAIYNLANLLFDEGRFAEAESMYRRSLTIREDASDAAGVVDSLAELGLVLLRTDRAVEALHPIVNAAELAEQVGLLPQLARAQIYHGQVLATLGRVDEALAVFERCAETVELLRERTTGGEQARQVFLSSRIGPYQAMAQLHAAAGRPMEALLSIERARARTLLDILAVGRQPTRDMTPDERAQEADLNRRVITASLRVTGELQQPRPVAARVADARKSLDEARLMRQAFRSRLYAARPELRLMRGDAPVITPEQLAEVVGPQTAAVEYMVTPGSVLAMVVTSKEGRPVVQTVELPVEQNELLALADTFARQVAKRDLAFSANAQRLYGVLIGPVQAAVGQARHLILVPDASLWRLPFQALQAGDGTYLIEQRSLSYAPSLSALAALRQRQHARAERAPFLVALGNPAVPSMSASPQRSRTTSLPEAAREVQALGRLYGAGQSEVLVDRQATEPALRAVASKATVLHVATHGVLDDHAPMYSHLVLATAPNADATVTQSAALTDNDGRLESWEFLNLDLSADLVVLSACQTARGVVGGGEGVIGLSWALLASGASTAVLSQWAVDSTGTTELMIAFHEHRLRTGAGSSESLRRAAMTLMKDPRYRHPFYWAGFIAMGIN